MMQKCNEYMRQKLAKDNFTIFSAKLIAFGYGSVKQALRQ
jgi:hypothetical protein